MSVTVKDNNRIPDILRELQYVLTHQVQVGIFGDEDSHQVMVGSVHEFGCTITPSKGKWLTIPSPLVPRGKSAADYPDLFRPRLANGQLAGVMVRKSSDGKTLEPLFYLVTKVDIPERSFIRSTYDAKRANLDRLIDKGVAAIFYGRETGRGLLEALGAVLASWIQATITDLDSPPNAPITAARKGSTNPLIDTGRMRQSVTYRVVGI